MEPRREGAVSSVHRETGCFGRTATRVQLLRTSKERIWIVDLAAFATWRQWFVNEEGEYLIPSVP